MDCLSSTGSGRTRIPICQVWTALVVGTGLIGCASAAQPDPADPAEPSSASPATGAEAERSSRPEIPPTPQAAPACAEVDIGLDLRALPTNTAPGGIDLFVRGEAWDFQSAAPQDSEPRVHLMEGVGALHAFFDGATEVEAIARCEATVAAYLPTAPNLPMGHGSAASVITPCHPCE